MTSLLHSIWFKGHPLKWLFLPLSLLFWLIVEIRKKLFSLEFKKSAHPGVPVLVIGNISVGGNGKTPVVLKTVEWLIQQGWKPGILSRGYGGQCKQFPHQVTAKDSALWVGDEPKLLAMRSHSIVVTDPNRTRGANYLADLGCTIIVCDDGLQHYALQRDMEWVVMDDRAIGNGWLLPMGPLREYPSRLDRVDALIHNGVQPYSDTAYLMTIQPTRFVNVQDPSMTLSLKDFVAKFQYQTIHAVAGIGAPKRFFATLNSLGIERIIPHEFVDHHQFTAENIPTELTVMTEKDAVKCTQIVHENVWYLEVDAELPTRLKNQLIEKLHQFKNKYS